MSLLDEYGRYTGPTSNDPAAHRWAHDEVVRRSARQPHIQLGENRHHVAYIRMKTDEALYRAGLISINEMHRDADPSEDFSLVRLARDAISLDGSTPPPTDQRALVLQRASGSATYTDLLNNIVSKALALGYDSALDSESWTRIARVKPVKDFRDFDVARGAALQTPPEVTENGPVGIANTADEGKEQSAVKNHVEIVSITRQAMLSDDLNALVLTPARAGAAIVRLQGDLVIGALVDNNLLSDGVALFDTSTHGNLASSGAAPSVTTIGAGFTAMGAQVDALSQNLNILPRYILAAPALASTICVLANSFNLVGDSTSNIRLIPLVDGRLTGNAWYLVADPMQHSGIDLYVLAGSENRPRLERIPERSVPSEQPDGVYYKLGYDVACVPSDSRGLYKNAGA